MVKHIHKIFFSAFLFCSCSSFAQVNLVPNPSFEIHDTCPNNGGQINYAVPWVTPTTGTVDYYNSCYDTIGLGNNQGSTPRNYFGYQNTIDGVAYCGVFAYAMGPQTYREYIQAPLNSTLVNGTKYYVTFYVSLGDSAVFATDDIGAYFSVGQITRTDYDAFGYTPQIANPQGTFLSNKNIWYKITGSFIASGGENHITLGNFKNDTSTDTVRIVSNLFQNMDYNSAYFYIDEVCVSTDSLLCNSTIDIKTYIDLNNLVVYCNNNMLYIRGINEVVNIKIYDIEGKLALKQKINKGESKMELINFPNGVYIVKSEINNQLYVNKICIIKNP